ncbi:hypothetical protein IU487_34800 [Nocardia puris]|uniref:DUF6262 family protein n=1 Tax=Nocardia puris TaxID=208602 RepID=UPI0018930019|nr:DUF6262 family protein [Nocardia puris]MBF6216166.1 hypothetical protein [Nocardia puris]
MNNPMIEGRRADSARRRARVIQAINTIARDGGALNASAIARTAGVDRTFLYRHRDLLTALRTAQTLLLPGAPHTGVSVASLTADLANAGARITRLAARNRQLENKLSELLGQHAWRESGLGAATDIDQLQRQITLLEQQVAELHGHLEDRDQELEAARAANRELFANMNRRT